MSPEQASAGVVDARSDQYSLATMLYEMLVGEPPFTGPTVQAVVARRFAEPARPIRTVRSAVPEGVERAVLRALERAPVDRYPDVAAFAEALRRGSGPVPPSRSRHPPSHDACHRWRRHPDHSDLRRCGGVVACAHAPHCRRASARQHRHRARSARRIRLRPTHARRVPRGDRRVPRGRRRDSSNVKAWTGLAKTYVRMYERAFRLPGVTPDSMLRLAVTAVERARAIAPNDADVWSAQAIVSRHISPTDGTLTLRAARRAVALDSTNAVPWHYLAIGLMESGDADGAMRAWRHSVRADSTYTQGLVFLALGHMWRRSYDSAAVWADSGIAVDPNYLFGWMSIAEIEIERRNFTRASAAYAAAYRLSTDVERVNAMVGSATVDARAGRVASARAEMRAADSLASAFVPVPLHTAVYLAHAYAALGDADRAIRWLGSYATRGELHFQLHLRCDPSFDPIARDKRFRALLVRERPAPSQGCR